MMTPRPGFDGAFIGDAGRDSAWLVIDGWRHYVEPAARLDLMREDLIPIEASALAAEIPVRGSIRAGSALVRGAFDGPIFLLAEDPPGSRLHRVATWESFVDFGFAISKVRLVPEALLRFVPPGSELWSARDRIRRRGNAMHLPLLELLG